MSEVMGRWVKQTHRCDYCHKPFNQLYDVSMGDCQGKFCSRLHFEMAAAAIREKKLPEHERPA